MAAMFPFVKEKDLMLRGMKMLHNAYSNFTAVFYNFLGEKNKKKLTV